MFDGELCRLTYSHSDYSDVWAVYEGQMSKFLNVSIPHFWGIDKQIGILEGKGANVVLYDDTGSYVERLISCLEQLTDYPFLLFDHEDMFLYAKPDVALLCQYYAKIKRGELDYIRLIKGGNCKSAADQYIEGLFHLNPRSKWIFSIQPSLWRREKLLSVLYRHRSLNIWELETRAQKTVKSLKIKSGFCHLAGNKRGLHHFDNTIYPYVATAIGKGQWNFSEYKVELAPILLDYDIDPDIRGVF